MFRSMSKIFSVFVIVAAVFVTTGCEEDPRFATQNQYLGGTTAAPTYSGPPPDSISYWDGDNLGGKPSIKISVSEQKAYFYKNGLLVGISQLSTGREGLNTPTGKYSIIQKDKDHVSTMYGDFVDSGGQV